MRPIDCVNCVDFPCSGVNKEAYRIPNVEIEPEKIRAIMLSEATPKDSKDPQTSMKFFIEKKDGTKIGVLNTFSAGNLLEIGFTLIPSERGKGYCTEAVTILVDCLFLSRNLIRIQATTDLRNMASHRVLEKIGFKREGIVRKSMFIHGELRDLLLHSILREEWKEPRILTRQPSKKQIP